MYILGWGVGRRNVRGPFSESLSRWLLLIIVQWSPKCFALCHSQLDLFSICGEFIVLVVCCVVCERSPVVVVVVVVVVLLYAKGAPLLLLLLLLLLCCSRCSPQVVPIYALTPYNYDRNEKTRRTKNLQFLCLFKAKSSNKFKI
jgi:hypothetical protein